MTTFLVFVSNGLTFSKYLVYNVVSTCAGVYNNNYY